ncbi:MAG: hypothetical protein IJ347_09225 [Faecalibacterium sp.]|nr:hypothetical protein [Faecalibacterium sp.]
MRKILLKTVLSLMAAMLLFVLVFGDPLVLWNNLKLKENILSTQQQTITLHQVTPFVWDTVYTFSPYTSKEEIARVIGFSSISIKETVSEGMTQLLFVDGNRVVCSVCAYPSAMGYGVSGLPSGQPIANETDAPKFNIHRRGGILWLQYLKE